MDDGPLLFIIGALFLFAFAGLISSLIYQWRRRRQRKAIERTGRH